MTPDAEALARPLAEGDVRLELLTEEHIEPLRAACAEDPDIWDIFPVSMLLDNFDEAMRELHAAEDWVRFAALQRDEDGHFRVVGMTNYIRPDSHGVVEIGGTYIAPSVRGTGFNDTMKRLMIDHAFACGFRRIEFRVDTRNRRSMAALKKLGATHEGTLRKNLVTWTGYVRDSAVFAILAEEWPTVGHSPRSP